MHGPDYRHSRARRPRPCPGKSRAGHGAHRTAPTALVDRARGGACNRDSPLKAGNGSRAPGNTLGLEGGELPLRQGGSTSIALVEAVCGGIPACWSRSHTASTRAMLVEPPLPERQFTFKPTVSPGRTMDFQASSGESRLQAAATARSTSAARREASGGASGLRAIATLDLPWAWARPATAPPKQARRRLRRLVPVIGSMQSSPPSAGRFGNSDSFIAWGALPQRSVLAGNSWVQ